jgi:hypothetical protein
MEFLFILHSHLRSQRIHALSFPCVLADHVGYLSNSLSHVGYPSNNLYHSLSFGLSLYPLKTNGNDMYHLLQQSVTLYFVFMCFVWFSLQTAMIPLNSVNQLVFVMVKNCVFFAVRTDLLNII